MNSQKTLDSIQELIDIMALLRSENGCQWDRAQTPESLKTHILEEAYEVLEAIDQGDPDEICDELGDLLLQVVFQSQIFSESGLFGMAEVAKSISDKLKRRHPHIFADADHEGHEQRWEEIKQQERISRGMSNRLGQRIPATLPALKRCTKVARKLPAIDPQSALRQIQNQLDHLSVKLEETTNKKKQTEESLGILLQEICYFSASIGADPEELLRQKTAQLISEIDSGNKPY